MYPRLSSEQWREISIHLGGRSWWSCKRHYTKLSEARPRKAWTEEDIKLLLQEASENLPWKEVGTHLDRGSLSCQAQYEKLKKKRTIAKRKRDRWSEKEEKLLMRKASIDPHLSSEQWKEISIHLEGRSWRSCAAHFARLQGSKWSERRGEDGAAVTRGRELYALSSKLCEALLDTLGNDFRWTLGCQISRWVFLSR